ncbi:MFS transporter [Arenibaculum sp.]|jgi:MFS family permease|uniref:MFS transporter n=1 Tax=Arenibaculum sp. TaxID=2865862 RepID=UPI002E135CFA|nr:MFS transporter [Arenibaculum sp.]
MTSNRPDPATLTVWILIVGTGLATLARALSIPFLAIHLAADLGLDAVTIGVVVGAGPVFGMAAGPLGGGLSDRMGRRPVLAGALAVSALAFLGLQFAGDAWAYLVLNLLVHGAASVIEPVSRSAMSDCLAPERRLKAFSRRYVAINLGYAVGPLLAASAGLAGAPLFAAAAVAYGLFALAVAATPMPAGHADRVGADRGGADGSPTLRRCIAVASSDRRLLCFVVGTTLTLAVHGQMSVTLSQYLAANFEDGVGLLAILLTANAVTVLSMQGLATRVISRIGPMRALVIGCVGLLAGEVGFAAAGDVVALVIAMIVFTLGEVLLIPSEFMLVDEIAPPPLRGTYFGAQGLSSVGNFLGPWLGGIALVHAGGVAMFLTMGLLAVLGAAVFAYGRGLPPGRAAGVPADALPPRGPDGAAGSRLGMPSPLGAMVVRLHSAA